MKLTYGLLAIDAAFDNVFTESGVLGFELSIRFGLLPIGGDVSELTNGMFGWLPLAWAISGRFEGMIGITGCAGIIG